MRRGDILVLVDLSVGQFDALLARGLAPLTQRRRAAGWGKFTADDAFRIALFNALTRAGLPQARASSTVRGEYEDLIEHIKEAGQGDVWFGSFATVTEVDGEASATAWFPLIASFDSLAGETERVLRLVGEPGPAEAAVVVNATAAMRRMLRRAETRDIVDDRLSELARLTRAV